MKSRVISIRVDHKDLASMVEFCETFNKSIPPTISGIVNTTLTICINSMRKTGNLTDLSNEDALAYLRTKLTTEKLDIFPIFDFSELSKPKVLTPALSQVITIDNPDEEDDGEQLELNLEQKEEPTSGEVNRLYEKAIDEQVKELKTLEDEELLSKLLTVERREDDKDVKLIDPATIKQGEQEDGPTPD